ncbi:MAG: hypothetical protein ISR91_00670 [Candidatus Delongbacteria bacterium]|nr:hypothetical protein [Candidatus Delongbacteria bacterium]
MTRAIDLQDNFSKTKLIERLAETQRQQALQQQIAGANADEEKAAERLRKAQELEEDHRIKPDGEQRRQSTPKDTAGTEPETEPDENAGDLKPDSPDKPDHSIDVKA